MKSTASLGRQTSLFVLFLASICVPAAFLCAHDPTSVFFDSRKAYAPRYSGVRVSEALQFIAEADKHPQTTVGRAPKACVAIASISRRTADYFHAAVGSLLQGLADEERAQLHVVIFLAHSNQSEHPAHHESWLRNVADTLLAYSDSDVERVKSWEAKRGYFEDKILLDYAYLLRACLATGAEYTIVVEDDVIALDGWFHRAIRGAQEATNQMHAMGKDSFVYLRLFYTERFFGWNSENWRTYLFYSVVVCLIELVIFTTLRRSRNGEHWQQHLITPTQLLYLFVFTPALILLFFAIGRVSLFPLPTGTIQMPQYGCCSQALLFPRARVPHIIERFEQVKTGFVDVTIEAYADERRELRWAVVPSLFQHIGSKSSKDDGTVEDVPHDIFNFQFESNDAARLRSEHEEALLNDKHL